jgi:predicted O-linked N-acetylglucosamine transferase (SPINDLY family)
MNKMFREKKVHQSIEEALSYFQKGALGKAKKLLVSVLEQESKNFDANLILAIIYASNSEFQNAITHFSIAIDSNSKSAVALFNRANALFEFGNFIDALSDVEKALQFDPLNANGFLIKSNILHKLNDLNGSLYCLNEALQIDPNFVKALNNRGIVYTELKLPHDALLDFNKALEINEFTAEIHNNRGKALVLLKLYEEALISYDAAIRLRPDYVEAFSNRGIVLHLLKEFESAVQSFSTAINLDANFYEAYNNLSSLYIEINNLNAALDFIERALKINPFYSKAISNKILILYGLGRFEYLINFYLNNCYIDSDYEKSFGFFLVAKLSIFNWSNLVFLVDKLLKDFESGDFVCTPFNILLLVDSPKLHLQAARNFVLSDFPTQNTFNLVQRRSGEKKLKLGFYSADLRYHPVCIWLAEQVENHDRSKFELFAFSINSSVRDPMRERLEAAFDHFFEVDYKTDLEIVQLSRDLGIDIALDLSGHTHGSRPGIFAARVAPIQVNHLGFPGSSGADYIDFLISDEHSVTEEMQQFFTEKIVYIPCGYTYDRKRIISEATLKRSDFGLPENVFVFTCQNGSQKISPEVFGIWMDILLAVPNSVLWLLQPGPTAVANLMKEAEVRGVNGSRLVFTKRETVHPDQENERVARYLASYRLADLFLDTWPYNAGTTAIDALWAGLPVLTKTGQSLVARMATSALMAIDMPELITATPKEYMNQAISLATNNEKIQLIKNKLQRNKFESALFDPVSNTKHIENAYIKMFNSYLESNYERMDATNYFAYRLIIV